MSHMRHIFIVLFFLLFFHSSLMAIPSFNQVKSYVAQHPDNIKARYLLGKMYLQQGEPDETLKEWKYIVRKRPTLWKVYYKIGMVQYKIGAGESETRAKLRAWKKAMRTWQHVVKSDRSGKDGQRARSAYLKVKAKYVKLANRNGGAAEVEVKEEPVGRTYSQPELAKMMEKAKSLYKDQEYLAASELYKILYNNKYKEKETLYYLGKSVLKEAEEPEKAVEYFKAYAAKYKENAELMKNMGQAYGLCAEFRKQITCYQKSLEYESGGDKADIHFQLALAFDRLGKHNKTIEHAQLAVQLNPDYKKKLQPLIKNSNLAQDVGSIVDEVLRETEDSQLSDEQINEFARRVGDILGEENMNAGRDMIGDRNKLNSLKDSISGGLRRGRSY